MFSRTRNKRNISISYKNVIFSFLLFVLLIFLFVISTYVYQRIQLKVNFEKNIQSIVEHNSKNVFSLDKIFLFSSANGINTDNSKSLWNLNIYQYTDIAIFINNNYSQGLNDENVIQKLYIDNFKYGNKPEYGTPSIYYKNLNDFGKSNIINDNLINDSLNFNILDSNQEIDYSKPNLYNSCQNPITLMFVNNNIKNNVIIPNTETLTFDGSILKKSNITLNSIKTNISFNINIINNLNELFVCNINIDIPLEENNTSILNGYLKKELNNISNYKFYKVGGKNNVY